MLHEDIDVQNQLTLNDLRTAAEGLSVEELVRPIDPPWTTSALFAHMAFWDRFTHARWLDAGGDVPIPLDDTVLELVNQAALREWTIMPPTDAVQECLVAGDEIDGFIRSLQPSVIRRVVEEDRRRLVDRSIHRGEHIRTVEAAFPGRFQSSRT